MMECPHCAHPLKSFNHFYLWPYAINTCKNCNKRSVMQSQPWLTAFSILLGASLILPLSYLATSGIILYLVIVIVIDYQVDKKFRRLKPVME